MRLLSRTLAAAALSGAAPVLANTYLHFVVVQLPTDPAPPSFDVNDAVPPSYAVLGQSFDLSIYNPVHLFVFGIRFANSVRRRFRRSARL